MGRLKSIRRWDFSNSSTTSQVRSLPGMSKRMPARTFLPPANASQRRSPRRFNNRIFHFFRPLSCAPPKRAGMTRVLLSTRTSFRRQQIEEYP